MKLRIAIGRVIDRVLDRALGKRCVLCGDRHKRPAVVAFEVVPIATRSDVDALAAHLASVFHGPRPKA